MQYRAGVILWGKLLKRITRKYGKCRYIQTWERHQRGGAHVNITLESANFQGEVYNNGKEHRHDWLAGQVEECGFGWKHFLVPVYNASGLAGYLTKLCAELTGAGTKNQIPIDAPPHFRRLRASQNTLPPVIHGELTGAMVFAPIERFGGEGKIVTPALKEVIQVGAGDLVEIPNEYTGINLTTLPNFGNIVPARLERARRGQVARPGR